MKSVITLTGNEIWTEDLKRRLKQIPSVNELKESKDHPKVIIAGAILSEPDVRAAILTNNFHIQILADHKLPF